MKDLANLETEALKRIQLTKMHDYKGFTVEPVPGGFNIVMYGIKNILYVAGPGGWRMTEDLRQARAFNNVKTCHDLIDEVIADWQGWVQSLDKKKIAVNLGGLQQEQVRQNVNAARKKQGIVM